MLLLLPATLSTFAYASNNGESFLTGTIRLGEPGWKNGSPSSVVVNPATNIVYVANRNSDTVYVINATTNRVVDTISVGLEPIGIAFNPNTDTVYAVNSIPKVSVINATTNKVMTTLDFSGSLGRSDSLRGIAVNTATNKVYVLIRESQEATVAIIDGRTNQIKEKVKIADLAVDYDVQADTRAIAVNSQTNMVYVASDFNLLHVIDGSDNRIVKTVTVGRMPDGISVNERTNTLYVSNFGSQSISVIDGSTNKVVDTITPFFDPQKIEVDEETNTVYVTSYGEGISIIDGASHQVRNWIKAGEFPEGAALNPDNGLLYVANAGSNSLSVIQTLTEKEWKTAYAFVKPVNADPSIKNQIFKIEYRTINGTTERFDLPPQEYTHSVDAQVSSSNDVGGGILEIRFPRNYPYTDNAIRDSMPTVLVNGKNVFPGRSVTNCFFVYSIPFTGDSSRVELSWPVLHNGQPFLGDYVPDVCLPATTVQNSGSLTPLQQLKAGTEARNVVCPASLTLVVDPNSKPYCATPASAEILKERWQVGKADAAGTTTVTADVSSVKLVLLSSRIA